jgi:hypothetical protein
MALIVEQTNLLMSSYHAVSGLNNAATMSNQVTCHQPITCPGRASSLDPAHKENLRKGISFVEKNSFHIKKKTRAASPERQTGRQHRIRVTSHQPQRATRAGTTTRNARPAATKHALQTRAPRPALRYTETSILSLVFAEIQV